MKEFTPFRLDAINQCLWRRRDTGGDERILLAPKAFGVLAYLVEHAGRLVTEGELLDAVWPEAEVQPQVIKSQLFHIRKALGDDAKTPSFIETMPKRGYRFIGAASEVDSLLPPVSSNPPQITLVGRDQPLAELQDRLQMALGGQRQIVFITGEQGIGKTALADEFHRRAATNLPGLRVARGQCLESYGPKEAYYPMLEALGQLLRGPSAPSVIDTLTAQAPTWLVQFPALVRHEHRDVLQAEILGATRERMLREINEALETISAEQPLLLLFEDLHWADISTVDLISTLARGRAGAKLMLLATCRPVDLMLSNHSLKGLMHDLVVHQLSHELALQPLGIAEVAEYLGPSPQANLPKGLVEMLHRHSDGNPLFLLAALEDLIQRGLLSQENGHWRLTIPVEEIDFRVPESLREMIEARIARLSVEEQRALEAASVSGTAFCVSMVASVTNVDFESFEELCEQLTRRYHIVRSAAPLQLPDASVCPRYEFVHGLYRELLYHRQARGRRARLHQRIGERLEALYANWPGEVALELAHHFEASSDWSRAVKYLRLAADTAIRRLAHAEAFGILHRALDLASKLPQAERTLAEKKILSKLAMTYTDIKSDDEHQQRHADLAESLQLVDVTGEQG